MRISTFFYTIKQGFRNIFRNKLFSLASIATITACLFMFGIFYSVVVNLQNMVENAEEGDIILLIGKGHEQYQEIKGVKYFWDERQAVKEVEEELKKI